MARRNPDPAVHPDVTARFATRHRTDLDTGAKMPTFIVEQRIQASGFGGCVEKVLWSRHTPRPPGVSRCNKTSRKNPVRLNGRARPSAGAAGSAGSARPRPRTWPAGTLHRR